MGGVSSWVWVFWARLLSPCSPLWLHRWGHTGCLHCEPWRASERSECVCVCVCVWVCWAGNLKCSVVCAVRFLSDVLIWMNVSMFPLQGVTYPAMMAMWARWAPPLERSRLMTLSGAGGNFGAFIALPFTGYICQTLGWPAVFYIFGEPSGNSSHWVIAVQI